MESNVGTKQGSGCKTKNLQDEADKLQKEAEHEADMERKARLLEQKALLEARIADVNEYGKTGVSAQKALERIFDTSAYKSASAAQRVNFSKNITSGLIKGLTGQQGGLNGSALKSMAGLMEKLSKIKDKPTYKDARGATGSMRETLTGISEGSEMASWGAWASTVPLELLGAAKGAGPEAAAAAEGLIEGAESIAAAISFLGFVAEVVAVVTNPECANPLKAVAIVGGAYALDLGVSFALADSGVGVIAIPVATAGIKVLETKEVNKACK